ncbi:class A beta-lactamase [Spirosoma sp. KUDC1026]|uniref:class A beta-lactamase n=1 Tax=Spirosoma sp. KUDC1026 TaxID=2745947 RepID=UPI00159BEC14|nr:class A beta-lactamase [Spirosoma sp. KUDC1026]QKZ13199.1 class A beta-lactamase [Spirosoma sp. KUDC1026]
MKKRVYTNGLSGWLLSGMLLMSSPGWAQTAKSTDVVGDVVTQRMAHELERIARQGGGQVGVQAIHLESGRQISLNPQVKFPMASTIKIAIAVQLLTKIEQGELALSTMVDVKPTDLHPGSGTLTSLFIHPGVQLSVQNLLELMIVISDNSATDILLGLAGGPEAVMNRLKTLNVAGMSVDRSIIQLLADLQGVTLPPADQWTAGFYEKLNRTPEGRKKALETFAVDPRDTSTPAAMVDLLTKIYQGKALKPESRQVLLDVMGRCQTGNARIKGFLPPGTDVAHKTGSLGATATDDVGYITLPDNAGHVAIAVFIGPSTQQTAERDQTIAHLSRAVYDYFLFQPAK